MLKTLRYIRNVQPNNERASQDLMVTSLNIP